MHFSWKVLNYMVLETNKMIDMTSKDRRIVKYQVAMIKYFRSLPSMGNIDILINSRNGDKNDPTC